MKKLINLLIFSVLLSVLFGCTTTDEKYNPLLRPPEAFNPTFLRYQALPGQKVMVVAIDIGGDWAFGYDYNCASLAEAAENAALNCDTASKKNNVRASAKLFAVNDEVVYYENQFK